MSREQGGELSTSNLEKCSLLVFAARLFFRTATFESATFQITVYSFSRRDFFFAAPLSNSQRPKLQFTPFRGATFFSRRYFRKRNVPNQSLILPVHSFALRQFRNYILLVFAAPVYLFSWRRFRNCSLFVFAPQALPNRSKSFKNAPPEPPKCSKNAPQNVRNREKIKSRREKEKSVKKRGRSQ